MAHTHDAVVAKSAFVGRLLMASLSSGYLVVVWCFVVDSVAHESGVAGGACAVPEPCGFAFHGWALDEGALSLLGDFEVVPVPGHEDVGCGAVVEFLAAPPFVVFAGAPLVSVGVEDLCACHVDGGGHFVPVREVEVEVGVVVGELVGFCDGAAAVYVEGVVVGGDSFAEAYGFSVVAWNGCDCHVGAVVELVDELHHGHAGEPDLFRQGCLCAPGVITSL